jgi:two-component system sensor histidine kinase/response regulator
VEKSAPQPTPDPTVSGPFMARAVRDLKVPQKLRLCGMLAIGAGLIPSLILLFRLKPNDPASIEKQLVTSLVLWTVVVQVLGLLVALLVGRQVLRDVSNSLRRLGNLVKAITTGDSGAQIEGINRRDEIGSLALALQRMILIAKEDRHKLIQGNVALVLTNERLAQTNMELEAAGTKVRQLAEQAGEANVAKRNFLAIMSHEIRTPVNGIIGMTELTLKTPLNTTQREYLEMVNDSAQSLLDLLNDILDFSKIEAGKLELEIIDFSLRDTLEDALATYAARFHAKSLELILDIRPNVPDALVGDPFRLRQVVLNLIGNALRFTSAGEVTVRVEAATPGEVETLLRFTVADTGCGIAADTQAAIFEAFTQADNSTTRRYGGTGLGLAICKQLTQLMGGWISVQSEVGKGSEFQFRARFGVGAVLQKAPDTALAGRRVLLVESHTRCAELLCESLSRWGIETETAKDATAAMARLKLAQGGGRPYDFVIADTFQPQTHGFDVARMLTGLREQEPKLLLLLPAVHREDTPSAPNAIAQLTKPVRLRKLRAALTSALQPAPAIVPAATPLAPGEHPHGRRLRVLVVEDNATNLRIVRTHLETWGHLVVCAEDGEEAVAITAEQKFDLIFMDLQMPRMDGIAATAIIRDREKGAPGVPIVALTANVLKGAREQCLAAGMDAYLGKPVREHELLACVETIFPDLRPIAHTQSMAQPAAETYANLPFDAAALMASINNNRQLLNDLLHDSRDEDIPELVTQLSQALGNKDTRTVARAAHAIKGVIGVFHAPVAYAAAKRLEDSARSGKDDLLSEQASDLLRAVFDLLKSLERFIAGLPSQAPEIAAQAA